LEDSHLLNILSLLSRLGDWDASTVDTEKYLREEAEGRGLIEPEILDWSMAADYPDWW